MAAPWIRRTRCADCGNEKTGPKPGFFFDCGNRDLGSAASESQSQFNCATANRRSCHARAFSLGLRSR